MARSTDRVEFLARVPLLARCSKKELKLLDENATIEEIPKSEDVVREGQLGDLCYVILSGEASVRVRGRNLAILRPGECFGELAVLDPGPRTATVTALSDMELLVLHPEAFLAAVKNNPNMAMKLLTALAQRLRVVDAQLYR